MTDTRYSWVKAWQKFACRLVLGGSLAIALGMVNLAWAEEVTNAPDHYVRVTSKDSLIHLGSLDSFDITDAGTKAAELVYDYLINKRPPSARKALSIYQQIIPSENFGGEYTAFEWFCEYFLASKAQQAKMLADPISAEWYKYFSKDNFAPLKEYLKMKYHLLEWKRKKTPKSDPAFRFLEDFILFNNPFREKWEKSSKTIEVLNLKPGDVVADIGSGPGYYTFKFADLVGENGFVYAVDTNPKHIEYVTQLIKDLHVKNVEAIDPAVKGLQLPKKADLAYLCSLYHNIYAMETDEERDAFIGSIKKNLKPGGTLVIIDNGLVTDKSVPYHGPYIAKELIINQLWYYGFRLVKTYQFIPQRYILVFKLQDGPEPAPTTFAQPLPADCVPIPSKLSLLRTLKNVAGPGFSMDGRKAARLLAAALEKKDSGMLRQVVAAYQALIPKERFGDEYLALQWICEHLLASPAEKEQRLADWFTRDYYERLSAKDFVLMKTYLRYKYFFDEILDDEDAARAGTAAKKRYAAAFDLKIPESSLVTQDQINEWGDFISFNSPYRESWEKTSKVLEFLKIKPGTRVADLGCGPGYYTFKFSDLVGSSGIVYAVDTLQSMLDYINGEAKQHAVRNVETVLARENNTHLPANSVDLVYICSMYHAVYFTSMEYVKDEFIDSLKKALRKNGRLVIADNALLADTQHPYYGPRITPEMIIYQLKYYGFQLVERTQFIPQRYVLVFERAEAASKAP